MIKKPTLISSTPVYDGWVKVRRDKLQNPDMYYETIKIGDGGGGVGILPFLNSNTVLLAQQYRYAVDDFLLELIQGGKKEDETAEQAAKRELLEETGCEARLEYLFAFYPLPTVLEMEYHIFAAYDMKKITEPHLDPTEEMQLLEKSYDNLVVEVKAGKHKDSALVAAVLQYELVHRF